jgi:hypothetical protein
MLSDLAKAFDLVRVGINSEDDLSNDQ